MKDWYYLKGENRIGPVSSSELKALAQSGELRPTNLVWKEGLKDWTEAIQIKGLFPSGSPPPPPPSSRQGSTSGTSQPASLPLGPPTRNQSTSSATALANQEAIVADSTATSENLAFGEWYKHKFGNLPLVGQIVMWLFYGYVWIPVYYATSNNSGPVREGGVKPAFSLWIIWCYVPYLAGIGWLHAGIRSNYKPYFLWAVVYCIPFFLFAALVPSADKPPNFVMALVVFAWFAGAIHASLKKREVNLRIKYASAQRTGDVELENRIRAEYEAPQQTHTPANSETPQPTSEASLLIPNQTSLVMRFLLFTGAAIGAWIIERLLDKFF